MVTLTHPWPNQTGNIRYWTRERVLEGLQKAAGEIRGPLPAQREYDRLKSGHYDWPTSVRVLELYGSMAKAWLSAGASRDRVSFFNVHWTGEEETHLLEHAGAKTLKTIGGELCRSYGSAKRHLHDIGITARANQGYFSAAEMAKHYGCPYHRVRRLLQSGIIRGEYDEIRNRWQVDLKSITADAEALLKAPKQTYKTFPTDLGDYYQRHGLHRHGGERRS